MLEAIAVATERTVTAGDTVSALLGMPAVRDSERRVADSGRANSSSCSELGAFRDKFIAELSTGSRRMVELACLIANEPQILLLDEPSSGIAQREAEALGPVLKRVQDHLDASILIIEHDMPLLTGISDRLIALDIGRVRHVGLVRRGALASAGRVVVPRRARRGALVSPTIAQRGPAIRLRTLSLAALGTAVVVTGVAVVPDLFADDDALPSDVGVVTPLNFDDHIPRQGRLRR